jgi:hypothetical protein
VPSERLRCIRHRLLERIAGRDAAGHVGKADAVTRPFVLVYQCDIACYD